MMDPFTFDPSSSSTIILGGIVAVSTFVSPLVMTAVNARIRKRERAEDYTRQDEVAKQAAEAARLLAERQDQAANKAAEAARVLAINTDKVAHKVAEVAIVAADSAVSTNRKLDIIHTLVNSNMTAAMQAELDATIRELAMMQEVIDLKRAAGKEPSIDALAAVESTKSRIAELTTSLTDRKRQADTIAKTEA